ncbi:MAG TPA: hypothetical protein VFI47_10800 [Acidimicrobiales bacterium]|nr:hypothetical protein [Acidimicrobiales bacterium]
MRPRKRRRALVVAAIGALFFVMATGTGTSGAQEHDPHDPEPTVTNPPSSSTLPPQPGSRETVIQYGPYSVQAAPVNPDGTHGHAHTGNRFQFFIRKPCTNCYVTGMTADLVYADGTRAGWSTDAQLHHMVMFASGSGKRDATCSASFLGFLGQRFFASGDERTPIIAPPGYGYFVGAFDQWNLIWELANHHAEPQNGLYIAMKYNWVPANTPGMKQLEPVWLDVNQCGTSEISVPQGPSTRSWTWNVNRPGKIIGVGGHVHDGGINIDTRNVTTGQMICDSVARYGGSPLYTGHHGEGHLSGMSVCQGTGENPVATVQNGQRVTITGHYNMPEAVTDQMGIVVMYLEKQA